MESRETGDSLNANGGPRGQTTSEKAVFFFFLALFSAAIILVCWLLSPFFATIVMGLVVMGAFAPLNRLLQRRLKPGLASMITCLVIFFVVLVPVLFFVGVLSKEAYDLYQMAKSAVLGNQVKQVLENTHVLERVNHLLATMGFDLSFSWEEMVKPVSELGRVVGLYLFQQASFVASNVFKIIFYFCLMLIVVFYLFIDGARFVDYIYDISPLADEHNEKLFCKFKEMAGAVLVGNGLGGLIQGVVGGGAFFMLGLASPFLWGVIMGFLAFLPILGIGVVLIPTGLILMLKERMAAGIFILVLYAVLSWGIEYVFKPKVVGDRVKMHPLVVFFSIIGGLEIYGILGIIYGPLIITLFLTLADIYFANFQAIVEPDRVKGNIKKDSSC
ncbi:putative permease [Desulforapulum autotrophicum HRM2]|uniref:Permease n=1 Tax=Desulforapulum autotrophicum (strain ATCC 43914 / DSM 3382 / VKM B-1955 / HRM2) TaxID=177437 RepID=C0QA01_DESAH|nr:AI-2E family transporter [Desulforapulum autotrophicum]ACN16719.1 putative permease [Desulforapulum autotrophicum HRM2]